MDGGSHLGWRSSSGLEWLEWRVAGACAVFPTRAGGVSPPPWRSLNLGSTVGDDLGRVRENRRRLCVAVGLPLERLVVLRQVHGRALVEVGEAEAGRGSDPASPPVAEGDALVSDAADLGLCVGTADCLPVVIVADGDDGPVLAAVHAGWRGVLAGVIGRAASALAARGSLRRAIIGPSIGPCCFHVDEEIRSRFASRFVDVSVVRDDRAVDLWAAAMADLAGAGLPRSQADLPGLCTSCDARFFSHRRDEGLTGRHLTIAWRRSEGADDGVRGGMS